MSGFSQVDGYVADTAYPSKFHPWFQAPWLDAVLALRGVVPPRGVGEPFTLVDLGCGDGIGLILAAASHPHGSFVGVDALAQHIARGQSVIDDLGLTNITLHCAGFADVPQLADGSADYVTSQGVLAWVGADNRNALLDLASHWLKPGGAFCVGYNTYPGWHAVAPFQALVRATALEKSGNSTEKFNAAVAHLRGTGAIAEGIWEWLDDLRNSLSETYFAHEYLNAHWQPCWSGDVVTAMGERGMAYIGQSGNQRLRDDLCYTQAWREALAGFESISAREIAADLLSNCWFRRDVYLKMPGLGFDGDEGSHHRMHSWWALSPDVEPDMGMTSPTLSGEMDFDNAAAHAILAGIANGPACLAAIAATSGIGEADILNSIDALWIASRVVPLDAPGTAVDAERVNAWLKSQGIAINGRATKFGAIMKLTED